MSEPGSAPVLKVESTAEFLPGNPNFGVVVHLSDGTARYGIKEGGKKLVIDHAAGTLLPNLPIDYAQELREKAGAELRVQGMAEGMLVVMQLMMTEIWTDEVKSAFKTVEALGEPSKPEVAAEQSSEVEEQAAK